MSDDDEEYDVKPINSPNKTNKVKNLESGIDDEDEYYFDAKQESLNLASAKDTGNFIRLEIPTGARLNFDQVTAAGTTKDLDGTSFTVYYIEMSCSTASPNKWTVYRRYNQFRKISDVLRADGCFVPVLPPRKMLMASTMDTIKSRKTALDTWIRGVMEQFEKTKGAKDPQKNPSFISFLTDEPNCPPQNLTQVFPSHLDNESDTKSNSNSTGAKSAKGGAYARVGIHDFELVRVIGKGSFGKVTLVRKKDEGSLYAMKVLSKPNIVKRKQIEHTRTERRILGTINHPFIVRLHYAFQTDNKLYFVLDYAAGGELFFHLSRMKKFPENMARFYSAEITMALDELHKHVCFYYHIIILLYNIRE